MIDFSDEEVQKLVISATIILGTVMIAGVVVYSVGHYIWSALT